MANLVYINLDELKKVDKVANRAYLSREYLSPGRVLKLQALHIIDDNKSAWADVTAAAPEVPLYEAMKNEDEPPWLCIIKTITYVWEKGRRDGFNQIWVLHKYISDAHPAIFGALRGVVDVSDP